MAQPTPLHDLFADRGAAMVSEAGWTIPARFGDVSDEVRAAHAGVAMADVSGWGQFTLGGKDAVKYLQGLVTNDVAELSDGGTCEAAFLNVHGRFEAVCTISRIGDVLWIRTPPEASAWVDKYLGRFRLAGDFQFEALESSAAVTVQGPLAGKALARAMQTREPRAAVAVEYLGTPVAVLPAHRTPAGGFDVVGQAETIRSLAGELLSDSSVRPIGSEALEVLRIEAGRPRYLVDFDSDTVLQEIDLPEIASFNKGCYLGQEIVARIHFQGQPGKLLRRLELASEVLPARGDQIVAGDDDKAAGAVTSVTTSPVHGAIVFGMVKRKYYAAGTEVRIKSASGDIRAIVAERVASLATKEAV